MEIIFYWCGARVHFEEVGGLLCKKSGPNRYARFLAVGSRSEGLDLTDPRSNPGHTLQIGRSQVIGAHRRRWVAGAPLLRGGACPEKAKAALLGSFWAAAWFGSLSVGRVSHWGTLGRGLGRGTL